MSIRPERLVDEASRFSLRTAIVGGPPTPVAAPAPVAPRPVVANAVVAPHAVATTPLPPPTPSAAPSRISFRLDGLAAPSSGAPAPTPVPAVSTMSATTAQTLQMLAQAQKQQQQKQQQQGASRPSLAGMPTLGSGPCATSAASFGACDGAARKLAPGYISGGTSRVDTSAELLRLTATIDALNTQLASAKDKLARTEQSLLRANRSLQSERSGASSKLTAMQNALNESREREAALKRSATSMPSPIATATFEASVKKAEAYETQLAELKQKLDDATTARSALEAELSKARATEPLVDAAELARLKEGHAAAAAAASTAALATARCDELKEQLARVEGERDTATTEAEALGAKLNATMAELNAARTEAAEAVEAIERAAGGVDAVDAVETDLPAADALLGDAVVDAGVEHAEQPVDETAAQLVELRDLVARLTVERDELEARHAAVQAAHDALATAAALPEPVEPSRRLRPPPALDPFWDVERIDAPGASTTTTTTTTASTTAEPGGASSRKPRATRLPPRADATGLARARVPIALSLRDAFATGAVADDEKFNKLVKAIGADVMKSVQRSRKRYLVKSGLSHEEAQANIEELIGN